MFVGEKKLAGVAGGFGWISSNTNQFIPFFFICIFDACMNSFCLHISSNEKKNQKISPSNRRCYVKVWMSKKSTDHVHVSESVHFTFALEFKALLCDCIFCHCFISKVISTLFPFVCRIKLRSICNINCFNWKRMEFNSSETKRSEENWHMDFQRSLSSKLCRALPLLARSISRSFRARVLISAINFLATAKSIIIKKLYLEWRASERTTVQEMQLLTVQPTSEQWISQIVTETIFFQTKVCNLKFEWASKYGADTMVKSHKVVAELWTKM